jgi:primosomal protein N' (replication factor Y) (superfamily II helicase)
MPRHFCQVALPVPLRATFSYAVPDSFSAPPVPGSRVLVPFRKRAMVGVVVECSTRVPAAGNVREMVELVDPLPALPPALLELGRWIASYYLAPIGEVFRGMLPPAVEMRAVRELLLTSAGRAQLAALREREELTGDERAEAAVLERLEAGADGESLPAAGFQKIPGGAAAIKRLLLDAAIEAREVARRRTQRLQKIVAWRGDAPPPREAGSPAEQIFNVLTATRGPMPLKALLQESGVKEKIADRLIAEGCIETWDEPAGDDADRFEADLELPRNVLNPQQAAALDSIRGGIATGGFAASLLHGVTGSGKTEVYLGAIESALAAGRNAIVLVPEIALTIAMSRLLRARLGAAAGVTVLHSALADVERARAWWSVRRGESRVVVGTRSAVFAPFERLGLVIVDEEHESSYKQEEMPKYNGRDTALVRAKLEGAAAVLGSATPSLESYHHARSGKYRLLELPARVENRPLARVELVDLREDFRRTHKPSALSERLRAAIAARLAASTQALVLINRRGYSWCAMCRSCGAAVQCENCSISLTYHKSRRRLECHYCGFSRAVPKACPKCSAEYMYFVGEGAEQVEEQLRAGFPAARVARLDRDTVSSKREVHKLLGAFAAGDIDILVGTQMVAKGHDFHRVTLVGVVSADLSLALPDFRAAERTFQLLTQVAGRAGRGTLPGEVLIQTHYPEHYAIQCGARQDYSAFFEKELHFRRMMHYPPFTALAVVLVRDRNLENAIRYSRALEKFFAPEEAKGLKVLGPAQAPLARLRRDYRFQFLLKAPRRSQLTATLSACLDFCTKKEIPEGAVLVDIDPVNLL